MDAETGIHLWETELSDEKTSRKMFLWGLCLHIRVTQGHWPVLSGLLPLCSIPLPQEGFQALVSQSAAGQNPALFPLPVTDSG